MSKSLVIVESPTKAKTIKQYLPEGHVVEASVGHIRDLPARADEIPAKFKKEKWSRLGVNVEADFAPLYVVPKDSKKQVKKLKDLLADCDNLYLATDEDREGEAISWHLLELLQPKVPTKRLVFHEITKTAIQGALDSPREIDESLVSAQETRRILDRLYGYSVSPVLWRNVGPGLSAGRVQSVTTRLIVDREEERMKFVRSDFWDLTGSFKGESGPEFEAVLSSVDGKRIARGKDFDPDTGVLTNQAVAHIDEARAATLAKSLAEASFSVQTVEQKPFTGKPSPPFTTSTLQQESNRKLRLSARATMQAAQALYQNGLITYMRTDSTTLSQEAIQRSREEIEQLYGAEYLPDAPREYQTKVANAQEAHEAIRPSSDFTKPEDIPKALGERERKVYDLIWKRTMACQMENSRGFRTSVEIVNAGGEVDVCVFRVSGKTIEFPGYLRAYVEGADDPDAELADQETILPALEEGEGVDLTKVEPKGHTTQPPARYTEASLVKELEARGIGRPSTYASIIDTIQFRGYVDKNGTALVPTFIAFSVTKLMRQHFEQLVDYEFTAGMEADLDKISRGERQSLDYLRNFYFGDDQATAPTGAGLTGLLDAKIDARAVNTFTVGPDDEGQMINIRVGQYGPYLEVGEQEDLGERVRVTIPEGTAPDELDLERAKELIRKGSGPSDLGVDEQTGMRVYAKTGRFGPYFQLGENDDDSKPKMKSLLPGMDIETITIDDALKMLRLPLVIGQDPDGEDITADYGRYGAYIRRAKDTRSLGEPEEIWSIDVEGALAKLAEPSKRGRRSATVLKELGEDSSTGA